MRDCGFGPVLGDSANRVRIAHCLAVVVQLRVQSGDLAVDGLHLFEECDQRLRHLWEFHFDQFDSLGAQGLRFLDDCEIGNPLLGFGGFCLTRLKNFETFLDADLALQAAFDFPVDRINDFVVACL